MALPENPITRTEQYLSKIAGENNDIPEVPVTRVEQYLDYIARNGSGGGGEEPTYIVIDPDNHYPGSMWNARTNSKYGDSRPQYDCKIYTVTSGEKYKVTGASSGYPADYPCCAFFVSASATKAMATFGTEANTKYEDLDVTVPSGATIMAVNCYDANNSPATEARKAVDTIGWLDARITALERKIGG